MVLGKISHKDNMRIKHSRKLALDSEQLLQIFLNRVGSLARRGTSPFWQILAAPPC